MKKTLWLVMLLSTSAPAVPAVEFLGVELCAGAVDTSVVLPAGSALTLESAETGRHGNLLLLLAAADGRIMDHIDELMAAATGVRGAGDANNLQWAGNRITAYAQLIKDGYAALAVSTTDPCDGGEGPPPPADPPAPRAEPPAPVGSEPAAAATVTSIERPLAATAAPRPEVARTAPPEEQEFVLSGRLKHADAEDDWVDVMGVVVNGSGESFAVASFDLSLWDGAGGLICVDTISINRLAAGQQRAFRAAIRCPDYDGGAVASWRLQFAGGH